jgi:hypothetical protein
MRKFTKFLFPLAVIIGLAAARQVVAQDTRDTQFGDFHFKVPNGWNPAEKGGAFLMLAPPPVPGSTTFIALGANDLDGDLQKSFSGFWQGFQGSYRSIQKRPPIPAPVKNDIETLYTTAVATDQAGKPWNMSVMCARYGNRFETVIFMSDIPTGATYNPYFKIFQDFLANLTIGDALSGSKATAGDTSRRSPAATTQPALADSKALNTSQNLPSGVLDGIYVSLELDGASHVTYRRLLFSPDGWVVKDIPQMGMLGFDFTAYRNNPKMSRQFVGRYRVDGNLIDIDWQDFRGPAFPPHGERVKRDEVSAHPASDPGWSVFVPMCHCTGKTFSGKYILGAAAADQYLLFFADGTFIDHRVTDQLIIPNPFYLHPRTQRGTYSIQNQTMILSFADGHRGTPTFMAPKAQEKDPMFEWVGLGSQQFFEEHYKAQLDYGNSSTRIHF